MAVLIALHILIKLNKSSHKISLHKKEIQKIINCYINNIMVVICINNIMVFICINSLIC